MAIVDILWRGSCVYLLLQASVVYVIRRPVSDRVVPEAGLQIIHLDTRRQRGLQARNKPRVFTPERISMIPSNSAAAVTSGRDLSQICFVCCLNRPAKSFVRMLVGWLKHVKSSLSLSLL